MKIGTLVKHTRRNGETIKAKVVDTDIGASGDWLQLEWKDGTKTRTLWCRPSQVKA